MDWLGDWGGLLDSLYFIADILLSPLSAYMMKSKLAQLLVKLFPSESASLEYKKEKGNSKKEKIISKYDDTPEDPERTRIYQNMINHFSSIQRIEISSYLKSFIERFRSPKRHKLLEKSVIKIDK